MKIGILTFWWSHDNYGQLLQCYALQKYLRDMGHQAYLIRYNYNADITRNTNYKRLLKALNPLKLIRYCVRKILKQNRIKSLVEPDRKFTLFRERYLNVSEKEYSHYSELKMFPPNADAYIVGSDQIWNCNYIDAPSSVPYHAYFLDFGGNDVLRLSYAASWGIKTLPDSYRKSISQFLNAFNYVSVREESGIELCKSCGREDVEWVCDPTLLLDADTYRAIYNENEVRKINDKFLLLYVLNNEFNFDLQSIYSFAAKKGLEVIYVTGNGLIDDRKKYYATIPEWLYLIDNAEYVITNSYHCSVFSTIFNKRFGVIPLTGRSIEMNVRFRSLFDMLEIGDHFITEADFSCSEKIYNQKAISVSERFIKTLSDIDTGVKK